MQRRRYRGGFTLIELLVVITIICVLASMLFPCVSAVIANSRAEVCASNERQLLGAMMSYVSDHDGSFPVPTQAWTMDSPGVADFSIGSIWPYLSPSVQVRANVMHCPQDAFEQLPTYGGVDYFAYRNFSYSLNYNIINFSNSSWNFAIQLRQVMHPSQHVLVYEEFAPNDAENWGPTDSDDWLTGRHGPNGAVEHRSSYDNQTWRESGRGNVGYFDGHVDMMSVQGYFTAPYYHFGPLTQ